MAGNSVLDAIVRFLADTKDVDKALDQTIPQKAGQAGQKAGTAMSGMFKTVAGGIGGAAFTSAIEGATKFEDQLRTIQTVVPNINLDTVGKQILDLSRETGKSTDDLTAGFYDLVSAGVDADKAINVLRDSAHFATGALGSTAESVDLVTSVLNAYGLAAEDSARVTDVFAKAVADGKVTAAELGGSIAQIAPVAASAGVKMEEVSAGFAKLTAKGVPAAQAATQMRAAISALLTPNEKLNEIQTKTGKNFTELAKAKGLAAALEELRQATGGNADEFAKALGSIDAYQFALATTGENAQDFQKEIEDVSNSSGLALEQYNTKAQSAAEQGNRLAASIKAFLIEFGSPFVSTFGGAVQAVGLLGPAFGNIRVGAKLLGGALGALLANTIGPLARGFQSLAAAGKLGGLFQDLSLGRGLRASLTDAISGLGSSAPVKAALKAAGKILSPIFAGAAFAQDAIAKGVQTAITGATPAINGVSKALGTTAGKAFSVAFAAAAVVGLALTYDQVINDIKTRGKQLADQAAEFAKTATTEALQASRDAIAAKAKDQMTEAGALLAIPFFGGFLANVPKEGADAAQQVVDVLDAEIEKRGKEAFSGIAEGAGSLPAALRDASPDVRAGAEKVGASLKEPIEAAAKDSSASVITASDAILSTIEQLRTDLGQAAAGAANALYDPIIKANEAAETAAELSAIKQKLTQKGLTADEVKELQNRRQELGKQLLLQNADLLTYGTIAEQISKTKAFLASGFWAQAYEGATPEQAAALDKWKAELQTHLEDMEKQSSKSGNAVVDGFTRNIQDGSSEVRQATIQMTNPMDAIFAQTKANARKWGYSTGAAYAAGLEATYGLVNSAANYVAKGAVGPMKASSPPGPESPLHFIDVWGYKTFVAYADGIRRAVSNVRSAAMDVAGAAYVGIRPWDVQDPSIATRWMAGVGSGQHPSAAPGNRTVGAPTLVQQNNVKIDGLIKARNPFEISDAMERFQRTGVLQWPEEPK